MRKFVIISITRVHCAIGTQHDFGEGECDIVYDNWSNTMTQICYATWLATLTLCYDHVHLLMMSVHDIMW